MTATAAATDTGMRTAVGIEAGDCSPGFPLVELFCDGSSGEGEFSVLDETDATGDAEADSEGISGMTS